MTTSITDITRGTLSDEVSLEDLRDWLALYQWDLSDHDKEFADELDVALTFLDDGYIDKESFRATLSLALRRRTWGEAKIVLASESTDVAYPAKSTTSGTATNYAERLVFMAA